MGRAGAGEKRQSVRDRGHSTFHNSDSQLEIAEPPDGSAPSSPSASEDMEGWTQKHYSVKSYIEHLKKNGTHLASVGKQIYGKKKIYGEESSSEHSSEHSSEPDYHLAEDDIWEKARKMSDADAAAADELRWLCRDEDPKNKILRHQDCLFDMRLVGADGVPKYHAGYDTEFEAEIPP